MAIPLEAMGSFDPADNAPMNMKALAIETLRHMRHFGSIQLSACSEPMRQCLIDLGMKEPPLVEVDGNWVSLTEAGERSLP